MRMVRIELPIRIACNKPLIYGVMVIKIAVWIVESYDFTILHYQNV